MIYLLVKKIIFSPPRSSNGNGVTPKQQQPQRQQQQQRNVVQQRFEQSRLKNRMEEYRVLQNNQVRSVYIFLFYCDTLIDQGFINLGI